MLTSDGTYDQDECLLSLNYSRYFLWNTTGSSLNTAAWIYYSDYEPECWAGRCIWYATIFRWYLNPGGVDPNFYSKNIYDGLTYLNQSNKETCIRWDDYPMDTNFSSDFIHRIYPSVSPAKIAFMTIRLYYYDCAPFFNTTAFTDPDNVQAKRGVTQRSLESVLFSREEDLKQRIKDHLLQEEGGEGGGRESETTQQSSRATTRSSVTSPFVSTRGKKR
jgi:hypothetical protein